MPSEPVLKALSAAWTILRENGLSGCVMGGMATIHWGHARFTKDVDLLAVIEPQSVDQLTDAMRARGLTPRHAPPPTASWEAQLYPVALFA